MCNILKSIRSGGHIVLKAAVLLFAVLLVAGCNKDNNHLNLKNMTDHFVACGLKVEQVQPVEPGVVHATSAMAVTIGGKDIGIYKYDVNLDAQKKRIVRISDDGFIYIVGLKYPVMVNGSFVMIGAHSHTQKTEIVKAFNSFK